MVLEEQQIQLLLTMHHKCMLTATTGVITNPPTLSDYNNTANVGGGP